ncbi:MAG: carbohydrate binding domain-containing protein [Phycisphaeraceae bacterium]
MSFLNTVPAGANGRIVVREGHFVEEMTGRPLRFLGTNLVAGMNFPTHEDAQEVSARMAKYGINIVRLHHMDNNWNLAGGSGIWRANDSRKLELDPAQLDKLDYLVAQFKKHGIYVNINLKVSKSLTEADGFPASIKQLSAYQKRVDQFDRRMIDLQKDFARRLLAHVNPYTGLSYAQDPVVAVVEINNENSLVDSSGTALGAGLGSLPQPFRADLAKLWSAWLARRYADDAALTRAWAVAIPADLPAPLVPKAKWSVSHQGGANASLVAQDTGDGTIAEPAQVQITNVDGVDWHAQLHATQVNLRQDQTYTLSFRAKSSVPRDINVSVMRDQGDYRNLGLSRRVKLDTPWQDVPLTFTARSIVQDQTRITFNLGSAPSTVWIDNLKLEAGAPGAGLRPGESLAKANLDIPEAHFGRQQSDWVRFLLDTEHAYALEMRRFLRDELGVKATIINSQIGWGGITGYEREAEMDFTDHHAYWQHPRFPGKPWDRSNWTIGNTSLVNAWASGQRGTLDGLAMTRQFGRPFAVSEYDHAAPSDFAAECMPLFAGLAALQDWDAIYSFDYGSYGQAANPTRIGSFFDHGSHPAKFAFYPAAAMIFRAGLLPPAQAQYLLQLPSRPYEQMAQVGSAWSKAKTPTDIAQFLTHRWAVEPTPATPVEQPTLVTTLQERKSESTAARLDKVDDGGVFIAYAPAAVIVVGMVGGQTIQAGDITLTFGACPNNFAALTLTVMDRQPLVQSQRILLTLLSQAENQEMGWNATRTSVSNQWGRGPTLVTAPTAMVTFKTAGLRRVYALDATGQRVHEMPTQFTKGAPGVPGAPETAGAPAAPDGAGLLQFQADPKYAAVWYEVTAP